MGISSLHNNLFEFLYGFATKNYGKHNKTGNRTKLQTVYVLGGMKK